MVKIEKTTLFQAEKKPGRKTKEEIKINDINYNLESQLYNKALKEKQDEAVFALATVQTFPLKNMFMWIANVFERIQLEITPKGISLLGCECKKNLSKKLRETTFLMPFQENGLRLIDASRTENFDCKFDKILVNLDANELEAINDYITPESVVYMFINKGQYNSDTMEASSLEFHISEQTDTYLGYNTLTFTCIAT